MSSPKSLAESIEFSAKHPPGNEESCFGYGVMGLPFDSTRHLLVTSREG